MALELDLVNVLTLSIGIVFLLNSYRIVNQGREDIVLFLMSAIVGLGLIVVALLPGIFQIIANILGLELKARAILVISNLTLFVLVMYLLHRVGELYEAISKMNEEMSLLKTELEDTED